MPEQSDSLAKIVSLIEGAAEAVEASETAPDPASAAGGPPEPRKRGKRGGGKDRAPLARGFSVEKLNREWALVLLGNRAVIVREQPDGPIEDRLRFLTIDAFKSWYANHTTEVPGPDGEVKTVTWASAWLAHKRRRQYFGIEFSPDPVEPPVTTGYLNLWRGFGVTPAPKPNGYAVFADHLLTNVCGGDADLCRWVFGWFAHMVQRPRERIGTALVLRGKMGTGKTKIGEVIGSLFPSHYFLVDDGRYVTGQFNAHMASCLFLQAEEALWAGDKEAAGRLKNLVTSPIHMIELKGVDAIRIRNFVRLLMTSNEDWIVPAGKDERRFCVIDVGAHCAQNGAYFAEMDAELENGGREALLHDLLTFDLGRVDVRKIPRTDALLEQKLRSLDSIESWWFERLASGTTTRQGEAWQAEIARGILFADYLDASERIGIRRKAEETSFGIKMHRLIPGLASQRRTVYEPVMQRAWLYVLPDLDICRAAFERELGQRVAWEV